MKKLKDLGLQQEVMDALPYAVVGAAWQATFDADFDGACRILNHIVPAGQQLKILFLRVTTQDSDGAKFIIRQTNTGYTVVGSVPQGVRDYPMLESAGAEILRGGLETPVHVLEGSIDFMILNPQATAHNYGIVWWGVEKTPHP